MQNQFNFVERFAPLSSLQVTMVEITPDKFLVAPEGLISTNIQDDHVVVWYKKAGEDLPRFAQLGDFWSYRQAVAALLPIDLGWGHRIPRDLLAVLESAPQEVLEVFATWVRDFHPERYPSVRETWGWLNSQWGGLRP